MSLERCLSRVTVPARDQDAIRRAVSENIRRGMAERQAEQAAVLAHLDTVLAERTKVMDQLEADGVELPPPAVVRAPESGAAQAEGAGGEGQTTQRTEDDVDAERNEPLGELRGLYKWWQRLNRAFVSAADNLQNTRGGKYIADAIRGYVDAVQRRRSDAYNHFRPALQRFYKLRRADREAVNDEFSAYWEAVEHKPGTEAGIYKQARAETRELIDAWNRVADLTGDDLIGMGVQVESNGRWRPMRKVENFFPRTPDPEIRKILNFPEKYQAEYNQLADTLIDQGYIESRADMHKFVTETLGPELLSNDHFAGIERARGDLLPPQFYKRDVQAAINYIERWADRGSQIEHFKQATGRGKGEGDIFDEAIRTTGFKNTADYLRSVQDTIYNRRTSDIWLRIIQHLNVAATAIQLGNPATATLNLLGGSGLNIVTFGNRAAIKAFRDLSREGYRAMRAEAERIGVVRDSYLPLMRDLGQQDAILGMADREFNVTNMLRQATEKMLKWGGYTPTENFIRTMGMVMGKHFLADSVRIATARPNSAEAQRRMKWFEENNFDFERLAAEGGSGRYTEQFLRYAAMLPQGSYQIDQTPVFVDTAVGRFLFKYQKFGTQINRLFFKNHFGPFLRTLGKGHSAEERANAAIPLIQYMGVLFLAGEAIGMLREEFFDYIRRGPGWDEVVKAMEDDDRARGLAVTAGRAYHSMLVSGATGFIGNYAQMFMDFTNQERVKNPLDPPGLAAVKGMGDLALRLQGQGKITAKDLDEMLEMQISGYRTYKRAVVKGLGAISDDVALAQRQAHRADTRYIRGAAARYARDQGIEGARVTGPGTFGRTPMSPVNRRITDAMREGNPWKARQEIREHLSGLTPDERSKALRSMRASIRNSQPIRIHGQAASAEQRQEFLRWARRNLSDANYQRILERDREWHRYTDIAVP